MLVSSGLALQACTRAEAPVRWLARKFPRLATRLPAFQAQASETGPWAAGPTSAPMLGRCVQAVQYGVAARAVGIDMRAFESLAIEGVNLVASAVGVLVPGGFGTARSSPPSPWSLAAYPGPVTAESTRRSDPAAIGPPRS